VLRKIKPGELAVVLEGRTVVGMASVVFVVEVAQVVSAAFTADVDVPFVVLFMPIYAFVLRAVLFMPFLIT